MDFIIKWLVSYVGVMFAMSVDNIFWIPDSPEWKTIKKNFKVFVIAGREYGVPINSDGFDYTWNKRVLEVLKHPRDIIPATMTSFLLAVVL